MRRRPFPVIQTLAGVGVMGAFFVIWTMMFPPVAPLAPAPDPAPSKTRTESRSRKVQTAAPKTTPSGPFGFEPISYQLWRSQLTQEGQASRLTVLAPTDGPVGTTVEEIYRGPGSMVTIQYNDMIVMESPHSMTPYYQPVSSRTTTLRNGISAVWDLIASEGGPPYRLLFREDGTYVRLQLFHSTIPDTLTEATDIASMFQPLGSGHASA